MKTEMVIKQGKAKIVLRCENDFETDLIEKIKDSINGYTIQTDVLVDRDSYNYTKYRNQRIELNLTKN